MTIIPELFACVPPPRNLEIHSLHLPLPWRKSRVIQIHYPLQTTKHLAAVHFVDNFLLETPKTVRIVWTRILTPTLRFLWPTHILSTLQNILFINFEHIRHPCQANNIQGILSWPGCIQNGSWKTSIWSIPNTQTIWHKNNTTFPFFQLRYSHT